MADDETKQLLRQILDYLPTLASKRDLEDTKTELRADLDRFRTETRLAFAEVHGELKAINARLDEQRAVLVALIPTRIAAIPPAAE